MSSCCRSPSIRSAAHGAISRSACSRRARATAQPEGFARFVDALHAAGIGIILDWVPAHFPGDAHGLARFDGTALYEHLDPREGFHQDWNTLIYNFGRREVQGFLIASALHWLEHFHVDGLRVDAVASMLYRDYSRKAGEWVPNVHGGRENLEAVGFLRHLNAVVAERCPGAMMIAEESTAWPGVTQPVSEHGLGFAYKWNMGWMHDTLQYIERDPVHRAYHHDEITFGLLYAFSEKFILPLSHDEVVYGKHSLIGKMPGDDWQKFANLRAYFGFMWAHPGKKLLFMGGEIAQWREWNHDAEIDWHLLERSRRMPACSAWCATSTGSIAPSPRCTRAMPTARLSLADRRRPRELGVRVPALRRRGREAGAGRLQHDAGAAPRLSRRRAARRAVARDRQHRLALLRRQRHGERRRGRTPLTSPAHGEPQSLEAHAAAARDRHAAARGLIAWQAIRTGSRRDRPIRSGATWDGLGTNFAVFSAHAERIDLCLFDPSGKRADRGLHACPNAPTKSGTAICRTRSSA